MYERKREMYVHENIKINQVHHYHQVFMLSVNEGNGK